MKTTLRKLALFTVAVAVGLGNVKAQTAYFTNFAGGDWNAAANWDLDFLGINGVPAEGTNASITTVGAVAVDYNTPMAATSLGALSVDGGAILNINAAGFNQDLTSSGAAMLTLGSATMNVGASGVWTATNGGTSTIALGGILNVSGSAFLAPVPTTPPLTISAGGSLNVNPGGKLTIADGGATAISGTVVVGGNLTISNSANLNLLTGSSTTVEGGVLLLTNNTGTVALGEGTGSDANAGAAFTNNAGQVTFGPQLVIRSRDTRFAMNGGTLDLQGGLNHNTSGNDARQWFRINGGTANLNTVTINRAVLNQGGLLIEDGVVNSASMRIGTGIASANSRMDGGVWTNSGAFYIGDRHNPATGSRRTYFVMNGGELVTLGSDGIVINNQGQTNLAAPTDDGGTLDINGGTITADAIYLNGPAVSSNAYARFELSGGTVYLGSLGLIANTSGSDLTAVFTLTGGTLAAKDDWTSSANLPLGGNLTFQAANAAGTARNITLGGVLSSSGGIVKTGAGILTLNGANTYSGITTINEGTMALGAAGSIANTPQITIASGANFDITAAGYTLGSGRTLAGSGTVVGSLIAASGATLSPGLSEGTLSFSANLTQSGNVLNVFEISAITNDVIEVAGNLDISGGINTVSIIALGGSLAPGTYNLFRCTGTLVGTVGNLDLVGAPGFLTNNTTLKTIQLVTTGVRAAASVVWVGNATENVWDVVGHTNWLNGVTPDVFVQGDVVRFDETGSANPNVNIVDNAASASVTVDATANYTFSGSGALAGTGGLTKTNSGSLVINTTNSYSGPTIIQGGVLEAASLANGGTPSSIGASPNAATNLVLDGGTLRYPGGSASVNRGATLGVNGGTIAVPTAASALTLSGILTGDGSLTKTGAGTLVLSSANNYTNGTVLDGGVLQLNTATAAGTGSISNNGATLRGGVSATFVNAINITGVSTLDLNNVGGDSHFTGAWSGDGTVTVINQQPATRTLTIGGNGNGGGNMTAFSGTINMGTNSGTLRYNDGGGNPNLGSPSSTIDLGTGTATLLVRNGGVTIDVGELRGGSGTIVRGRASGSSGTVTYSIGAKNVDSTFAGSILDSTVAGNLTAITKAGAAKLTLTGTNTYSGNTIVNEGTLQVDGSITASPFVTVFGGTLSGSGSISGAVDIQANAVLSPGNSIGQLTMNGTLTLGFGSTNLMEINKAAGTSDSIVGLQSVVYGGTLVISNLAGALAYGDTFKLFDSLPGTYFGAFDAIELPALGGDLFWDTSLLTVDGTIRVSMTGPLIQSFGFDGNNFFLTGTNGGNTSAQYVLLSATNVALPLANWTALVTNSFDGNGNFAVTNAVNPSEPQRYFLIRTYEEILSE